MSKTHGKTRSRIYKIWWCMKQRCGNPNDPTFRYYGARGIKVCVRWLMFENFYADMGDPPKDTSIERIDNNQGYCPENCKWATSLIQGSNKRNNVLLTFNGKTQCLSTWVRETGLKRSTILNRLKAGWSIEKTLTSPADWGLSTDFGKRRSTNLLLTFQGKTQCLASWAEETGIGKVTISYRLKVGWPIEKALSNLVDTKYHNKKEKK